MSDKMVFRFYMQEQKEDMYIFDNISRATLDGSDNIDYAMMAKQGLDEEVVRQISESNKEPNWMLEHRMNALKLYRGFSKPTW